MGRKDCISFQTRPKWMLNFMSKPCCRNLFRLQICFAIWLHLSTGRRDCTHGKAAQDWIVTNCSEFIGKDKWPPNSPDLNPLDYHIWELYSTWMVQVISTQAGEHRWAQFCSWYVTSCYRTRSTKSYWAFRKDFGLVWKLMDTSNIR